MDLQIEQAGLEEAELLAQIARQSFQEAFANNPKNHPDDMKLYMDEAFSVETVSAELKDQENIYLLAKLKNKIAGYAKIRLNSSEDCISGKKKIELSRLYVLDEFIGKGVGKSLMLRFFEIAKVHNCDTAWLGVWEFNYKAHEFYKKWGFEKVGEHIFQLGNDPQIDWVLERKVNI